MLTIPQEYETKCENAGTVSTLNYGMILFGKS